ncbi:hypothetical protein QTO34_002244 [Cnephaeus nilssonii]|uniref:Piezo-type mechanosensitive ion channel component n=1 Tax=Cnephaeus nilssonii TaxID=3371016 RepID=A0AA40HV90_CNENI|nr:hypothetical protein QTO34_002244 [Eptesicus nilssonii]
MDMVLLVKELARGSTWEKTFRQIGFESLKGADAGNGIRVFVPDIGMFIASLTIWLICRNIVQKPVTEEAAQYNLEFENEELAGGEKLDSEEALIYEEDLDEGDGVEGEMEESTKLKIFRRFAFVASKLKEFIGNMITTAGKVVVTILLGSSGMMLPSLTSSVYFFVFLGLCTWWSWCRTFDPLLFSCLCVLLAIFTAGHLIGLYLYQFQFFQEAVPPNDYYARLFGIKSVVQTDCSSTWKIVANPHLSWHHHANPILLLVMYYTLATLIRIWLQEPLVQDERTKEERALACSPIQITAERRRSLWYATHYPTDERKGLLVTVNGNPVDYHTIHPSLPIENGPAKAELYSTPQYRWEPSDDSAEKKEEEEDEKEEFEEERSHEEKTSVKVHAMVSVFQFIMKQSYICALIAMMILFTITFWLLLRQHLTEQKALREKEALLSEVKIETQEIEEKDDEQDTQVEGEAEEKEEEEEEMEEKQESKKEEEEEVEEEDDDQDIMKVLGNLVVAMFIKYWIYVCGGMFFFVSFEGKIVMYKIIYMVLFLFCVALYQHHLLCTVLTKREQQCARCGAMRSVGVQHLLLQFQGWGTFPKHASLPLLTRLLSANRLAHPEGSLPDLAMLNLTASPEKLEGKQVAEFGEEKPEGCSEKVEKGELGKDSEEEEEEEDEEEEETSDLRNKWHLVIDRLTVLFLKFLEYFHKLQVFMWWILELHIIKIVSSYIIWVSVKEASERLLQRQPNDNETDIPLNQLNKSLLYNAPVDPTEWVGLRKSSPLLVYLRNNLLMLAILAFEVTVYRHQEYYRGRNNLTAPVSKTIFHDITRHHLDDGIINCAKYFINYFFYKFGLETCFLLSVNVIGQRMDFYAMIHACWLMLSCIDAEEKPSRRSGPSTAASWRASSRSSTSSASASPLRPAEVHYPWRFKGSNFNDNIIKWLYFPDFIVRPNPVFLVYDFMLLLCASLQWQIFEDENKAAVRVIAGDNVEICMSLDAASFSQYNPVPDFIHCRSYLDMSKVIIFSYLFWFVLTIIFITGTTRISIFCMGYLVACFYFLLFGGDLLLKPIKSILRYWDWLIAYNVFVITMKNILSIGACGYIEKLVKNSCWLIQAFSLACTVKGYKMPDADSSCKLPSGEAGIIWDSICFAFLLLQRRVFMSYYFLHVVADIKASQILASRGAELFQATIVKAVKARIEEEKKSMDQLKRQMDRIKARQQKYKKGKERMLSLTQESGEGQDIQKLSEEDDEMVRSGDYYLFETDSEEEEEEELKKEDEEPPRKSAFQRAIGKFASAILALPKSVIKLPKTILQYLIRAAKRTSSLDGAAVCSLYSCSFPAKRAMAFVPLKLRFFFFLLDNIIKRIFNILKFTWVLFLATVDSFTTWLNSISREHIDISTVLRIERCMLTREIKKRQVRTVAMSPSLQGNVPTRESIHMYYQNHIMNLSRESGLDTIDERPGAASGAQTARRMDSLDSHDSISSEPTQCTMLYSRQGTTETIEEVEAEQDEVEASQDVEAQQEEDVGVQDSDDDEGRGEEEKEEEEEEEAEEEAEEAQDSEESEEAGLTPDTELPRSFTEDGDMEVPPSYSKAVSFERLSFGSQEDSAGPSRMAVSPDDSRSEDRLGSSILPMFHDDELEESEKFYVDQPRFLLLFYAMYNTLVARSEMVCYFVIILNHMVSASVITLVLPILIFLWAMLSVPRPSRRFWMMAIVYTEQSELPLPMLSQCHGLWDEDDITDSGADKEESDDELSLSHSRRDSSDSLKSINLAASTESVHVSFPEQLTAVRRKRSNSSSQISHRSSFSSNRSQRGSTSTRNSSQKGSSVLSIKQRSKRELYLEKLQEHLIRAKALTIKKTLQIYVPIKQFFYNLIHPDYSAVTDVYVLMFLADTVDFIIIVFGFWAFGKHSAAADITSSLSEDQVPGPFLVMVLIQFGTMVVDRALYLRKDLTERKFSQNLVAQLWYFVKCVYFGLSAYQIRCGYPTRVLGNFLTKSYNYVNLFLFQGFRLVPFLTELRAVMDWVWTDTTLSLSSWICVEDIYAHIFILKCWRESEKRYPQPRGQKKKKVVKYGMGGMIIVLLICIVWFPLLFMSLIKSVAGVINQPLDVSVTITLGGYQPIFTMSAQQSQLKVMDNAKFKAFIKAFSSDTGAMQFLENYEKEDITVAELEGNSNSLWTISPPSKQKMIHELLDPNSSFSVVFSWSIQRNMSLGAKAEIATDKLSFPLKNFTRENIAKMIAGNDTQSSTTPVTIERIYPYYVKAPSDSNSKPIKQLLSENNFMNITIILSRDNTTKSNSEWWVLNLTGTRLYNQHAQALELVVFNDKVSPPSLGFLAGYGIMGLYASVVLVIGKFVREFFSGISHSIMFEELPNVDRILKLCTDIFLVRETGELELEEDLYAKLIFLYRSPETMIKWTREKTN